MHSLMVHPIHGVVSTNSNMADVILIDVITSYGRDKQYILMLSHFTTDIYIGQANEANLVAERETHVSLTQMLMIITMQLYVKKCSRELDVV